MSALPPWLAPTPGPGEGWARHVFYDTGNGEMLAIWDVYGFERGTILAINAGVDMLLFCNQSAIVPYDDDRGPEAVRVIEEAVTRGEIAEARIDEACARVLALKSRRLA